MEQFMDFVENGLIQDLHNLRLENKKLENMLQAYRLYICKKWINEGVNADIILEEFNKIELYLDNLDKIF